MDNFKYLCRVCLKKGETSIYSKSALGVSISDRLMACSTIHVVFNDGLPPNICSPCLLELNNAYNFRKKCEISDEKLKKYFDLSLKTDILCSVEESPLDSASVLCASKDKFFCCDGFIKNITFEKDENDFESASYGPTLEIKPKNVSAKKQHKNTNKRKHKVKLKRKTNDNLLRKTRTAGNNSIASITEADLRFGFEKPKERDKTKKHMCTTCGKTFLFHSNLLDHERVHSGDKPFTCNVCDRSFAQSGHLMIHKRTHSGVKPYQCEVCPRAFTVSHALKKHLRIHTGERPYSCSMCDKTFVTSYHLSNHFKRHTGDKKFKCDWPGCLQGFVNISEMKRHRQRHEKVKELPKAKTDTSKNYDGLPSIPIIDLQLIPSNIPSNINVYNEFRRCYESMY